MFNFNYTQKEIEIGKVDSENLLRSLVEIVHNAIIIEKNKNFDIKKYIGVNIENLIVLLEKTKVINSEEDKVERIRCVLDFAHNIEINDKYGKKYKAIKSIKIKPNTVYFLMNENVGLMFATQGVI